MYARKFFIVFLVGFLALTSVVRADDRRYLCELGAEAGCGYYVGDATEHIFQHVREVYGANFRYRFTQRWCLQVKGVAQRIAGPQTDGTGFAVPEMGLWTNQLVNLDVAAEYNFFRFGERSYDIRVKPITPYIYLGVGACVHSRFSQVTAYMPFGVGVKWKFAPRCNLKLAWQHNLYFGDNLEGVEAYNNLHELNGSNILNFDLTGALTVGLSVEFGKGKRICRMCYDEDDF